VTTIKPEERENLIASHTEVRSDVSSREVAKAPANLEETTGTGTGVDEAVALNSSATLDRSPVQDRFLEIGGWRSDEIQGRYRRAQANAMFDPETLKILERLANVDQLSLTKLDEIAQSAEGWAKFGLLMQAFFVEVIGSQARVTQEGRTALTKLERYTEIYSDEDNQP